MSLRVGELHALLRLDDKGYYSGLNKAEGAFMALAKHLAVIAAAAGAAIIAAGTAAGVAGVKLAADWEQANIAFTTMLGSGERAQAFMEELQAFAAKTPFELPGLIDASRKLLAFGFSSEKILPMLTSIGDAVSAMGGGAFEIDRVTRAIGQMQAKGKVSAEEMNQLAELGINGWAALAEKFGKTQGEVMKLAEQGQIDAKTGIQALLDFMDSKFTGSMEAQSQTIIGLYSTLKDTISARLREIGDEIVKTFDLKAKIGKAIEWLESNKQRFIDWGKRIVAAMSLAWEGTQRFISKLLGFKDATTGVIGIGDKLVNIIEKIAGWWDKNASGVAELTSKILKLTPAILALAVALKVIGITSTIVAALSGPAGWVAILAGVAAVILAIAGIKKTLADAQGESTGTKDETDPGKALDKWNKAYEHAIKVKGRYNKIISEKVQPLRDIGTYAANFLAGTIEKRARQIVIDAQAESERLGRIYQDITANRNTALANTRPTVTETTPPPTEKSPIEVAKAPEGSKFSDYIEKIIALTAARKEAWNNEVTAYKHSRELYLAITGKTYDAERLAAKHAYEEEIAQINATANLGISTRQRSYEAYAKYYQSITDIDEKSARKKLALEEQVYNFAKPLYLRMVELVKGESASKIAAIEMERRERRREAEGIISEKQRLAETLQQIDIDAQAQTNSIIQGLLNDQAKVESDMLDKRRSEYDAWVSEQRSKVQWLSSGVDIFRNFAVNAARSQIGSPKLAASRIGETQVDELRGIRRELSEIYKILNNPKQPLMGY